MGEISISGIDLEAMLDRRAELSIFDVRKPGAFADSLFMLPGAQWRDHETAADWACELPDGQPVIVYCVHGHEVSQDVVRALRALGHDARYLVGGFEGWAQAGFAVRAKPAEGVK